MSWTRKHGRLRDVLAKLIEDRDTARIIAIDAGIDRNRINWENSTLIIWQHLLEEATKQGILAELVADVEELYPAHAELKAAWADVQSSTVTNNSSQSPPASAPGQTTIVQGDQINVGNISGSSGIAIGRGASAQAGSSSTEGQSSFTPRPTTGGNGVNLVRQMVEAFNLSELADLCFSLNVDFDNIPGSTLNAKAREMYLYFNRRGRIEALLEQLAAQRPGQQWRDE